MKDKYKFFRWMFIVVLITELHLSQLNWKYQPVQKNLVSISGEILNHQDPLVVIYQYNPISYKKIIISVDTIDVKGHFNLSFKTTEPAFYYFSIDGTVMHTYFTPDDYLTLFVNKDSTTENIQWFGEGDIINQFITDFNQTFKDKALNIKEISLMTQDSIAQYFTQIRNLELDFLHEYHDFLGFNDHFFLTFKNLIYLDWCLNIIEKTTPLATLRGEPKIYFPVHQFLDTMDIDRVYNTTYLDYHQFLYHFIHYHAIKSKFINKHERIHPLKLFPYRSKSMDYRQYLMDSFPPKIVEYTWGRYLYLSYQTRKRLHDTIYRSDINNFTDHQIRMTLHQKFAD